MSDNSVQPGSVDLKALLEAGVHFGHQSHRWNPKMKDYIYTERDGVHIFDLILTAEQLEKAMNFARTLGKQGKTLVFVGTKRQAQEIVKNAATNVGAMYIINRWLGGLATNWEQVSKSIRRMNQLKKGLEEGKYDKYTKYERVQLQKEIDRLERFFLGVEETPMRAVEREGLQGVAEIGALQEEREAGERAFLRGRLAQIAERRPDRVADRRIERDALLCKNAKKPVLRPRPADLAIDIAQGLEGERRVVSQIMKRSAE